MGREAKAPCAIGAMRETATLLLESREIVVRGATLKRRFEIARVAHPRVDGDALRFESGGEAVALELGAAQAQKWLQKLQAPPRTLAEKLGIGPDRPAAIHGTVDDAALAEALAGATTDDPARATALVAVVRSLAQLDAAVAAHARLGCRHLWVVCEKGSDAALGDTAIRTALRGRDYVDSKSSAVSERLTATRYARR